MNLYEVMAEIEALSSERMKKYYISQGAKEPVFGVATGALKPIAKKLKYNQQMAEELYSTGNYDAMYLAGMIANPKIMTPADFDRWIKEAYFFMISDFIVAVTLAETDFAMEVADKFIESQEELTMSAGYSCYEWLLGVRKNSEFDENKLLSMLKAVEEKIHNMPARTRYAMNNFVVAVGVSYTPLHEEALRTAEQIGEVTITQNTKSAQILNACESIKKEAQKGRIGFKRRSVRC